MERRCKASWDHLKVIAKHEMKPQLKQKMSDFLKDCAERIIILKIVHRRIINRWVFKIRRFGGASRRFPTPSTFVVFLQVPLLPVVPRPPGLQRERHQRPPVQQNPQRVCVGVPDHP